MKIADYGRNVAEMIEYAKTIGDRQRRTEAAETIVAAMARVNPKITQTADYKHILWDHLMEMAGYELDVDCPYEVVMRHEDLDPHAIGYKARDMKCGQYGRFAEQFVELAVSKEDAEERSELVTRVGGYMKRVLKKYHGIEVSDSEIAEQVEMLSRGRVKMPEGVVFLEGEQLECGTDQPASGKKKRKRKKKSKKLKENS